MSLVKSSDGVRVFYALAGAEHPPEGGLILCHPSFSSHALWHVQVPALARSRRVVTWDYRGHGRSDAPEDPGRYGMPAMLEDLAAVHRDALGDAPAHVGGLSLGGTVAMAYALEHPERVRSLLLVNTGPGFRNPDALAGWQQMLERSAQKLERVGVAGYLEGRRAQVELLGLDPATAAAARVREALLESRPDALARFARQVAGPVPNLIERLPGIAQPARVLVGERDEAFQRASHVLATKLPRAERVEIEGAGHAANLDQPERFLAEVERFLAAVD